MNRISIALLVTISAVGLGRAAVAADMPTKAPVAPPLPVFNWTGFYVGGYYGSALGYQTGSTPGPVTLGSGAREGQTNVNRYGFTAGATVGYNWQFNPHWLVGLEGDIGYLGITNRTNIEFNDGIFVGFKTDWYGTARARFGYVTGPSLVYATGGAAFVHTRDTFGGFAFGASVVPAESSKTIVSWTAGGGVETKLSRAWSSKSEYLFIDGGSNHQFIANPFGIPTPVNFDHSYHVLRTGLNYKFGEDESFFAFLGAPLLPSDHDWNGFYVGVNVGGGQSIVNAPQATAVTTPQLTQLNGTGFAGGGQIGYNVTGIISPKLFVGVEGDIGALTIRAKMADWFDQSFVFTTNTDWYATARARFGVNTGPALLYFTAGGAWVHLSTGFTPNAVVPNAQLFSKTAGGWTFGGGAEVALDPRWSARLESLYIDVGHDVANLFPPALFGADFKSRFQVVRFGLNYKLGGDKLVWARN